MDGFDIESPLVCEGIVGDGCGGGRVFFVDANTLKVYDPTSCETMVLLKDIVDAQSLSKSGCIICIVCEEETIEFDLSTIGKTDNKI